MSTLIVGCGYLGQRVGEVLVRRGERVAGTVRSPSRVAEIARLGIEPVIADVMEMHSLDGLPPVENILFCVGYDRNTSADKRTVYVDGLGNLLARIPREVRRIVYASSTSVYGQSEGQFVDEESPTDPVEASGLICLEAEQTLRKGCRDRTISAVILRYSGFYGAGRILRRSMLERGEPIPGDPARFLNLIHIEDAAQAAVAALQATDPDPLILVSDDQPVERQEYYRVVAHWLNAPPPQFVLPRAGTPGGFRDSSNKRICNRKMHRRLGLTLAYPDIYRGVPAALGVPGASFRA
jgi:nucleoside-diphosphate-sugar epimerase